MATQFTRETTGADVVQAYGSRLEGKTVVITGASDGGIGAHTALCLAHAAPATIVLLARSAKKVEPVQTKIAAINSSIKTTFVPIELDDLDSVRQAAAQVTSTISHIDILINNAGIMATPFKLNKHGVESQFATNHLGHFLLTALLFPLIAAAAPGARIVNMTSDGYKLAPCRFEDYNFKDGAEYHPWSGYGQSKTANILFTVYLAAKLKSRGITSFAVHPGVCSETNLGNHVSKDMFKEAMEVAMRETGQGFEIGAQKTAQQEIATTVVAVLDPRIERDTGSYMEDAQVVEAREYATSWENAERLWRLSERLVGEKFAI